MTGVVDRAVRIGGYDEVSRLRQAQDYDRVLDLAPSRPSSVADLGCGTGALLAAADARWAPERLVGLDGSAERVGDAERRLAHRRDAVLQVGDLRDPPPVRGRLDLVTMTSVLHWLFPDEAATFAWVAGHLTPGGAFVLSTHHPLTAPEGAEDDVAREALADLGLPFRPAAAGVVPMGTRARSTGDVAALLGRSFEVDAIRDRTETVTASSGAEYADFHASTFGTYFSRLAGARQDEFFGAVARAAQRRIDRDGHVYRIGVRLWRARSRGVVGR